MTRLQQAYLDYNAKYFKGTLPKNCDVKWARITRGVMGTQGWWRKYRGGAAVGPDRPYIKIDAGLKSQWRTARMTLLHEMVHLSLPYRLNHSPRFHAEMLRLANAGAFRELW